MIRYGDNVDAVKRHRRSIDFSAVLAAVRLRPGWPRLRAIDLHRLLTPYASVRFAE